MTDREQPPRGVTLAGPKAPRTARTSEPRYWLSSGVAFALIGAVLTFALSDSDASELGVDLHALGGVLLAAGLLLMAAAGVQSLVGSGASSLGAEGIKSVGGLIAVMTGIIAVTALALVTTQAGSLSKESIVAITSSAFGIISTVIGAYLGIKISSEASTKTNETLKSVALKKPPEGADKA